LNSEFSKIVVAVDGPAGAGKSTVARIVAEKLGLLYIDTGAMYRAATWLALKNNLDIQTEPNKIIQVLKNADLKLTPGPERSQRVFLNDREITEEIRKPQIAKFVSQVSAIGEVREHLVKIQQSMGEAGGVILDGRDIGTTVFPGADLKIFLVASSRERALRRQKQQVQAGIEQALAEVQADIEHRDELDFNRKVSPLRQAPDAILIDTDSLTVEQVVEQIIALIKNEATV
jgi:CMP/dCMP kinase